jgi:hypothetical protein
MVAELNFLCTIILWSYSFEGIRKLNIFPMGTSGAEVDFFGSSPFFSGEVKMRSCASSDKRWDQGDFF